MILTKSDLEEFNIDEFIEQCLKLDGPEMLLKCQNFGILVQSINPKEPSHNNNIVINFTRFIKHLQLIITKDEQALKPVGMSEENFFKARPIVEKLVAAGYLKKNWLNVYKNSFKE